MHRIKLLKQVVAAVGVITVSCLIGVYITTIIQFGWPLGPDYMGGNHGAWRSSWFRYNYEYLLGACLIACACGIIATYNAKKIGVFVALLSVALFATFILSYSAID